MSSAIKQNQQFHGCFTSATALLQQQQLRTALSLLIKAREIALSISDDELIGANAQQNFVTTCLIIMGVQFRLQQPTETLATYHNLFHQLDNWLANSADRACQKRLRGYQTLAEKACRHLHLERLREEAINAQSNS